MPCVLSRYFMMHHAEVHLDADFEAAHRRPELHRARKSSDHDSGPPGEHAEIRDRTHASISMLVLLLDHHTEHAPRPAQRTRKACAGSRHAYSSSVCRYELPPHRCGGRAASARSAASPPSQSCERSISGGTYGEDNSAATPLPGEAPRWPAAQLGYCGRRRVREQRAQSLSMAG